MMKLYSFILFLFSSLILSAQYDDHIGLGNNSGIIISSSDDSSSPENTLNASGIDTDIQGASRFLAHATLAYGIEEIERLTDIGYEAWIDEQLSIPSNGYTLQTIDNIYEIYENCVDSLGTDGCNQVFFLDMRYFRYTWWNNAMRAEDQLRQKIALALSEILVISDQSDLDSYPHGIAYYYDILSTHAFGNYRNLLQDVTLNPSMGFYLSHINNPRTNAVLNIHPDENYAREIMQLFTIGLYELNNDGTRKLDPVTGLWIPTYDNDDIKGLAKIFTGLSGGKWADPNNQRPPEFGRDWRRYSLVDPMIMHENWHEPGSKTIVGGYTIEMDSGMEEINLALDHIFNHDNVGPFLSYRLIQNLVKSNPSPAYVDRVASVFNDNGSGVRGDLSAVVKAILLDEEAMECWWFGEMDAGKLRSPIHRYTQLLSALKADSESDVFWNSGFIFQEFTGQHPMSSPTVFNFYSPDYVPDEDFAYYNLVSPEMEIVNSSTSANYVNYMLIGLMRDYINSRYNFRIPNYLNEPQLIPFVNQDLYDARLTDELWLELGFNPDELVDYLDILIANGNLTDITRSIIRDSVMNSDFLTESEKAQYALFMIMINPDYLIAK